MGLQPVRWDLSIIRLMIQHVYWPALDFISGASFGGFWLIRLEAGFKVWYLWTYSSHVFNSQLALKDFCLPLRSHCVFIPDGLGGRGGHTRVVLSSLSKYLSCWKRSHRSLSNRASEEFTHDFTLVRAVTADWVLIWLQSWAFVSEGKTGLKVN